jgi:hypothetical protein
MRTVIVTTSGVAGVGMALLFGICFFQKWSGRFFDGREK